MASTVILGPPDFNLTMLPISISSAIDSPLAFGASLSAPTRRVSKTTGRDFSQRTAEGRVMTESIIAKILSGIPPCRCIHTHTERTKIMSLSRNRPSPRDLASTR
jgi:hypothetical protein